LSHTRQFYQAAKQGAAKQAGHILHQFFLHA
jgi:hypothetical protein